MMQRSLNLPGDWPWWARDTVRQEAREYAAARGRPWADQTHSENEALLVIGRELADLVDRGYEAEDSWWERYDQWTPLEREILIAINDYDAES
jgi:hypothetical protein